MTNSCQAPCCDLGFTKILLATDRSACAQLAAAEAIKLAKWCGATLYIISVAEISVEFMAWAPLIEAKLGEEVRAFLEELQGKARQEGVNCEIIVAESEEPSARIVEEARARQVEVIVMGTHGRTGLKRLMMGSVASRVIGHAPCKVLVVPGHEE